MVLRVSSFLLLLTMSFSGSQPASEWVLRYEGFGPVKVGMSLKELKKVVSGKEHMPEDQDGDACFYFEPLRHPHVSFMIEDGRVSRVDIDGRGVLTEDGFQVGDLERQVIKKYGSRVKVEPHQYFENGHYLTALSTDGRYGIRFATHEGIVHDIVAGRVESIRYVEGCM